MFDEEGFDRRQSLLAKPLEEPEEPFTREIPQQRSAQADRAARLDRPDWQILLKIKSDGINTLLPDVQALRGVARSLQARFRTEVTRGQIDEALRTAKTMFAMARHMGEHPTLIGDLVGIAIANMAVTPLEELLEQPRCPNLFWALTDLPEPLISLRTGIDGERLILWTLFRELNSTSPMSAEQIKNYIDPLDAMIRQVAGPGNRLRDHFGSLAKDPEKVRAARKRLVAGGLLEPSVGAFPVEQVLLLDEARECQARFDEIVKIVKFPAWQFEVLFKKSNAGKGAAIDSREGAVRTDVSGERPPLGGPARPADRPAAACRGGANVRRRARWCAACEAFGYCRAIAGRPVHGQAVWVRSRRPDCAPSGHASGSRAEKLRPTGCITK